MSDISSTMRLSLDAARWSRDWNKASRVTKTTAKSMSRQFGEVGQVVRGVRNNLAALGLTFGAVHTIAQSAQLDKSLIQTKQTAGATRSQIDELRESLFQMAGETGQTVENLKGGFDQLVQAGLSFESAFAVVPDINRAMAVSSAEANTLAGALAVASSLFDIDLTQMNAGADLLDKMVVAGRLGNVELEDIAGAFSKVGPQAKMAGLSIEQTLALMEAMSKKEMDPDKLTTSMQSAMRIFTDQNYKAKVSKAMSLPVSELFYNADNTRRDVFLVLDDIAKRMDSFTDERSLDNFIQKAFGETNKQTREGLINILTGGTSTTANTFLESLYSASAIVKRDLGEALDNAVTQSARLKNLLREAADEFSKPINSTLANIIQYATNKKTDSGLGLDGKDMIMGAGGVVAALTAGKFLGPKILRKFSGGALGTVGGVAVGKSLEATAGVTPVYVVNMPGMGMGGGPVDSILRSSRGTALRGGAGRVITSMGLRQPLSNIAAMGGTAALRAAGLVGASGALGYGAGTLFYNHSGFSESGYADSLGRTLNRIAAFLGNQESRDALQREKNYNEFVIEVETKDPELMASIRKKRTEKMADLDSKVATGYALGSL